MFFCGEAGPRAPRCPLELTEKTGPNGPESHTLSSRWGDLGIHTSGPPYCQADKSSNKHSHANDPQSIKKAVSKETATCPIRDTLCHPRRSVPLWPPYRPVPRPGIALCDSLERRTAHLIIPGALWANPPPRGLRRRSPGGGPGLLAGARPSPTARRDPRGAPGGVPHVRGDAAVLILGGHGGRRSLLR